MAGAAPRGREMEGGVQVQLAVGRNEGWEVGALLGALCRSMGITREDVGNIKLRENSASIELSPRAAESLESKRARMTKEGLTVSAVRLISRESGDRDVAAGRSHEPRRDRPERHRSERRERGESHSRKADFDRSYTRR
jgi:ATP-dependent RNA helicase DeaD